MNKIINNILGYSNRYEYRRFKNKKSDIKYDFMEPKVHKSFHDGDSFTESDIDYMHKDKSLSSKDVNKIKKLKRWEYITVEVDDYDRGKRKMIVQRRGD